MTKREMAEHSLHLLVDDQLDPGAKAKLIAEIKESPELQQKLAQISKTKELLKLAYIQELIRPATTQSKSPIINSSILVAVAASLIMTVGLTLGWISHQYSNPVGIAVAKIEHPAEISKPAVAVDASLQNARKYILHVDFLNENRLNSAIIETSSILDSYAATGLPAQLDMVFNMQAVRMFEPENAGQAQAVKALLSKYGNLELYAYSESIKMFLGEFDNSKVIPGFHTDRIVEDMISERIKQGWIYLKI
jgi:intracellular sulfur oxidation DsrE/DsrF family protein